MSLQALMRRIRHLPIEKQADDLNVVQRGHYAYYGIAGNIRALHKVFRAAERFWHKTLCSRSWASRRFTCTDFNRLEEVTPLLQPKLIFFIGSYRRSQFCEPTSEERSAGNPGATFRGSPGEGNFLWRPG